MDTALASHATMTTVIPCSEKWTWGFTPGCDMAGLRPFNQDLSRELSGPFGRRCLSRLLWKSFRFATLAMLVLHNLHSWAGELAVEIIGLPPLRILGQPASAHTQGLELIAGHYYVTARRDDIRPRRALLLRTAPARTDWDVWDITPVDAQGAVTALDHPGGMQSDGRRLWIPLAESKRNGRSIIRIFALADMTAGRPLKSEFEFSVNDHIGALAVEARRGLVLGANWDTETVYVWDLGGRLQRTLTRSDLEARGLGVAASGEGRPGVAVQDWKFVGAELVASGLFRGSTPDSRSRLLSFESFLESDSRKRVVALPLQQGTQLANEGMAVSDGAVYFLPEDLGATNRLFRARFADLFRKESGAP